MSWFQFIVINLIAAVLGISFLAVGNWVVGLVVPYAVLRTILRYLLIGVAMSLFGGVNLATKKRLDRRRRD